MSRDTAQFSRYRKRLARRCPQIQIDVALLLRSASGDVLKQDLGFVDFPDEFLARGVIVTRESQREGNTHTLEGRHACFHAAEVVPNADLLPFPNMPVVGFWRHGPVDEAARASGRGEVFRRPKQPERGHRRLSQNCYSFALLPSVPPALLSASLSIVRMLALCMSVSDIPCALVLIVTNCCSTGSTNFAPPYPST